MKKLETLVGNCSIFENVGTPFIRDVCSKCERIIVPKRNHIIRYGVVDRKVYFLESGSVNVVIPLHPKDMVVAKLGKGICFGEGMMFSHLTSRKENRNASIVTRKECTIFQLCKSDFDEILKDHPKDAEKLRNIVDERLASTHQASSKKIEEKEDLKVEELPAIRIFGKGREGKKRIEMIMKCVILQKSAGIAGYPFVHDIISRLKPKVFEQSSHVVKYGDLGKSMWFIKSGKVRVVLEDDGVCVAELGSGSFFGEISLFLDDQRRTANVLVSTKKCELFELSAEDVGKVLYHYPQISDLFEKERSRRLKEVAGKRNLIDVQDNPEDNFCEEEDEGEIEENVRV